ncbi:MAG: GNAT family N-acetyltransferase [Oscillospiraceae bacterium]|nr:GNAT family N-acetyltransferase [Oscillospiraceae bacterium]
MPTNTTQYRKVTPEEKLHVDRLQNHAFNPNPSAEREREVREKIEKGEYDCENTYGAVDAAGRVLAGMEVIPYTMWFDGHKVPMYGIGGVASMPETRRQGHIRGIFRKVFEDIYEAGAVFSHLYPFNHDYYRQFGYEHCGAAKKYTLPPAPARRLPDNGAAYEYIKGDPARDRLIEIFETYASRYNIMISRSGKFWDDVLDITLFGGVRLYYWTDAAGEIKSWVKFNKSGWIYIQDMAWTDREGMRGILRFLGMFEGAADRLRFDVKCPPEFKPEFFCNNLYEIEIENAWMGMSRVVNVKKALELMKKPEGEGKFTVKVNDGFMPQNSGTYAVEYGENDCAVTESDAAADIEVSERAFTQMILGVYGLDQIIWRGDVQINSNREILEKVFIKKPLLLVDHF